MSVEGARKKATTHFTMIACVYGGIPSFVSSNLSSANQSFPLLFPKNLLSLRNQSERRDFHFMLVRPTATEVSPSYFL